MIKLTRTVLLLFCSCSCKTERLRGVVEEGVVLPIVWQLESTDGLGFELLISSVQAETKTIWLKRSFAPSRLSPSFKSLAPVVDLESTSYDSWLVSRIGSELVGVIPKGAPPSLRYELLRFSNQPKTQALLSCTGLPSDMVLSGPADTPTVAFGFGCDWSCDTQVFATPAASPRCSSVAARFFAGAPNSSVFLAGEPMSSSGTRVSLTSVDLSSDLKLTLLSALVVERPTEGSEGGGYGSELRNFSYVDLPDGGRSFLDDVVVRGSSLERAPSRLKTLGLGFRVLRSSTSPNGASTYLLLLTDGSPVAALEVVKIDTVSDEIAWRRPLPAPLGRSSERIAATNDGLGYWATLPRADSGLVDIWYEFLPGD